MSSIEFVYNSTSPEQTREIGRRVGVLCRGGECILLHGSLGAGKTCFTQGLAEGLGVPDVTPVVSPTFVLHARYEGKRVLDHIDAYRLDGAGDTGELGFDEMYESPSVCVVEWAEILEGNLPASALEISFEITGESERRMRFSLYPARESRYLTLLLLLGKGICE